MSATSEKLAEEAQTLSLSELDQLVDSLIVLRARRAIEDDQRSEADLVRAIHEAVPAVLLHRARDLRLKRITDGLTPPEADELVRLTDLIEQLNAQRVLHLAQLAHQRGRSLEDVMRDLGIQTPAVE